MTPADPASPVGGEPALSVTTPDDGPTRAVALVLHGGRSRSHARTMPTQLAVLRMRPFAKSLEHAGSRRGLAVARLRFVVRGWNGAEQSPVHDTMWALGRLAERFPGAPVALVGHSMGGRTAVHAAGHPSVSTVVGVAPWIEPGDPYEQLAGRRLLFVHGDRDTMTSPPGSAAFARRAAAVTRSCAYVRMRDEKHAMLGRPRLWHELTTGFVLATMCDTPPEETVDPVAANTLEKVLAGVGPIEV